MPRVLPFRGLRFDAAVVGDLAAVVCPPYDVIGPEERAELQARSQFNAVHVELPADTSEGDGSRYRHAADVLERWRSAGALSADPRPAYYLHETRFAHRGEPRLRRDLIAAVAVEPWSSGSVLPHEQTFSAPKADRLALMTETHANVSPVWMLSRAQPGALVKAWDAAAGRPADVEFELHEERHRVWVVDDAATVEAIRRDFAAGGPLYIADGHHRYETALAYKQGSGADLPGAEATLAVITAADDPGLVIQPTHRLLHRLPAEMTLEDLETRWSSALHTEYFPVWENGPAEQVDALRDQLETKGGFGPTFGVYGPDPQTFTILEVRGRTPPDGSMPADRSKAWKALDVSVLHVLVLDPLLGELGLPREEALTYTRSWHGAFEAVRARSADAAFFLNPTPVEQILAVADAHDRMPEKSTYFSPKPPTGIVIRDLRQA